MMLRWISLVPPLMVPAKVNQYRSAHDSAERSLS